MVLVVGGGIGGSVLALALARRGWEVTVLEREPAPTSSPRPEVLHASTLAALDEWGLGERLRAEASVPMRALELHRRERILLSIGGEDLSAAGASPFSTDPDKTRALLLEAALATGGVTLRRGARVTDVIVERGWAVGVRAVRDGESFDLRGRLVVGDDGPASVVRTALGIQARLRTFPLEFAFFGLPSGASLIARHSLEGWIDPPGLRRGLFACLLVPHPDDRRAGVVGMRVGTFATYAAQPAERFWGELARLTPLAAILREHLELPGSFNVLRRLYGHAATYVADGAALIGDAAHPMSPVGAQGANAAIWDALALAETAHTALSTGTPSRARLAAYEKRRRAANERSLRYTTRGVDLLRVARLFPGGAWVLPALMLSAEHRSALKRRLAHGVATAFMDSPARA